MKSAPRANPRNGMNQRTYQLWRTYGMSRQDFLIRLRGQRGRCGLCKEAFMSARDMHVDHDHATGKVRGILHRHCNQMLGFAKDRPDVLRLGAEYLERSNSG